MRRTIRRTASNVMFVLLASASALPVALARDDGAPPRVTFQQASYAVVSSHAPLQAAPATLPELTRVDVFAPGSTLVARLDASELVIGAPGIEPSSAVAVADEGERYLGIALPRPNRWTSALATLALVIFFFMRRIV